MVKLLKEIYAYRELLWILVGRNLKIRYKSSVLGFFWSLLTPLLFIFIYAIFAGILKFGGLIDNYLQYLIVGIITWQFTAMCLNDSLYAVLGSSNLVKKTFFPRIILPLSTVLANLINFMLTSVVLILYLLLAGMSFSHVYLLPLLMITHLSLCIGISTIISAANVFFRDTEHIVGILSLAWFFLTPIIYPVFEMMNAIPFEWMKYAAFLNPMTGLECGYRKVLMGLSSETVSAGMMTISFVVCWTIMPLGVWIFQKAQVKFGDEL